MTRNASASAAVGAASGGGRAVQVDAERVVSKPIDRLVESPSFIDQDAWLHQVRQDPSLGNAVFVAAWAVSTLLRREGFHARSTLALIGAIAGITRRKSESSKSIRTGLAALERGGHLWIQRPSLHGPGHFQRYQLILKGRLV